MKHLARLEKSREFWIIFGISLLFFFLRFPSLFEPYWYGDEGIYEVLASGMNQGRTLYTEIWDNKPPLLYTTYALFGANQFLVRFASLLVGVATIPLFYILSHLLFRDRKSATVSTLLFSIFFGLPIIEGNIANAENFMALPIIAAGYLIAKHVIGKTGLEKTLLPLFSAGVLLGISFLYKTVGIFDFAAFFLFFVIASLPRSLSSRTLFLYFRLQWKLLGGLIFGFLLPFLISVLYFSLKGALIPYLHAIFLSNVGYVGYKNTFIIPQGLLLSKLLLLTGFVVGITLLRKKLSLPVLFIALWTALSLFNSYFSQRPYTHYLLVVLPSISLLGGLALSLKRKQRIYILASLIIILFFLLRSFHHWSITKTVSYYPNFLSFVIGNKSVHDYQSFFDRRVPRDEELARYFRRHASQQDTIFLWGNNAQVYVLSKKLPPGRFTVAYHILTNEQTLKETERAFIRSQPKYIAIFPGIQKFPFSMYNYTQALVIRDVHIYERID